MADTYIRNGTFPGLPNPPFTLGMEGSGTIEAMGTKVRGFTVGTIAFSATQTYAGICTCRYRKLRKLGSCSSSYYLSINSW